MAVDTRSSMTLAFWKLVAAAQAFKSAVDASSLGASDSTLDHDVVLLQTKFDVQRLEPASELEEISNFTLLQRKPGPANAWLQMKGAHRIWGNTPHCADKGRCISNSRSHGFCDCDGNGEKGKDEPEHDCSIHGTIGACHSLCHTNCAWRQTGRCSPTGPRMFEKDKDCDADILLSDSGFCDCNGDGVKTEFEVEFDCSSTPLSCNAVCQPKLAKIPYHVIMTGKEDSIEDLPDHLQFNVERIRKLNPGIAVKYFSDADCKKYVDDYYDTKVAEFYKNEARGAFRGDICRAAVLNNEGGFYADLDLEMARPFSALVDESTDFMSSFDSFGNIYNALTAVVPGNIIMNRTMQWIHHWYNTPQPKRKHRTGNDNLGPRVMRLALAEIVALDCPERNLTAQFQNKTKWELEFKCGRQSIRLYNESLLDCKGDGKQPYNSEECTGKRASVLAELEGHKSKFQGLHYGVFAPAPTPGTAPRHVIAWSRVLGCNSLDCGSKDKGKGMAASLDEYGFKDVVATKSNDQMSAFMHRVLRQLLGESVFEKLPGTDDDGEVTEEAEDEEKEKLSEYAPFYTGERDTKSWKELIAELSHEAEIISLQVKQRKEKEIIDKSTQEKNKALQAAKLQESFSLLVAHGLIKREEKKDKELLKDSPWICHKYNEDQNDEWCQKAGTQGGFEYTFTAGKVTLEQCVDTCWCCKRETTTPAEPTA